MYPNPSEGLPPHQGDLVALRRHSERRGRGWASEKQLPCLRFLHLCGFNYLGDFIRLTMGLQPFTYYVIGTHD